MNQDSLKDLRDLMEVTRRFNKIQFVRFVTASPESIRPNEWHFLGKVKALDEGSGVKPSVLAQKLNVTPGSITQTITSLEEKGLVERSIDKDDRRVVRVKITTKGNESLQNVKKAFTSAYEGLVNALGEEDCRQLASLLNKACDYFDRSNLYENAGTCGSIDIS